MSGQPSEAEIQTQWQDAVDILETTRNFVDGTLAGNAGKWDNLIQSLKGNYLPNAMTAGIQSYRDICSTLIDPSVARAFLEPVLFEYGRLITDHGGGYESVDELARALYDWFESQTITIETRAITFDTSASVAGTGNGVCSRLTVDEYNHPLEAVHIETKIFKCRQDQNTGADEHAEQFECLGAAPSQDSILYNDATLNYGSGEISRAFVRSHHAGGGTGGSVLRNSSFSTYNASGSPKYSGWTEASGSANIGTDTTTYYREHPPGGSTTQRALSFSGDAKITQSLSDMTISQIDRTVPYFCRLMWNRQSSSDGTLSIKLGGLSATSVAVNTGSNGVWNELIVPVNTNLWPLNFIEDGFDIEIELASHTTGSVLVDDVLFAPYDFVDGTYWFIRHNAGTVTPWKVDDTISFTGDSGGAPGTGKLQWWFWRAFNRYLPAAATGPNHIADP